MLSSCRRELSCESFPWLGSLERDEYSSHASSAGRYGKEREGVYVDEIGDNGLERMFRRNCLLAQGFLSNAFEAAGRGSRRAQLPHSTATTILPYTQQQQALKPRLRQCWLLCQTSHHTFGISQSLLLDERQQRNALVNLQGHDTRRGFWTRTAPRRHGRRDRVREVMG